MALVGQGVGVATDEVVQSLEQLALCGTDSLVAGLAKQLLGDELLAHLVLVEVNHVLHTRNLAREQGCTFDPTRDGLGVEVVVVRHRGDAELLLHLLIGELQLHIGLELEAGDLEAVVLLGKGLVEEALQTLAGSVTTESTGEKVVELYRIGIHNVSLLWFIRCADRHPGRQQPSAFSRQRRECGR